jgi:hypothetical protein
MRRPHLIFELLQVVHQPNSIDYFFDAGPRRLDSATALRLILLIVKPQLRIPVMAIKSLDARSLMDEFLPHHDFKAAYELSIHAPSSVVYECLLRSDFNDLWLVRLLVTIRTGKRMPRNHRSSDLRQRLQGTGFVILSEVPNEEIVIGVAGRFWRPDGGRCMEINAEDFAGFSRSGFAKVAWNFKLRVESPRSTVLSTETRIKCFGQSALWKFRVYWSLVGPFSGFMRKAILKQVKTETESRVEPNPPKVWTKE